MMMMMNKEYAPLLLLAAICVGCTCGDPSYEANAGGSVNALAGGNGGAASSLGARQNTLLSEAAELEARDGGSDPFNNDKRVERYAFGLGRRAYTYNNGGSNGVKRLPVYNFGLGKRARPYSFGLGKRAGSMAGVGVGVGAGAGEYDEDEQFDSSDLERNFAPYAANFFDEKRSRPYSFGLGKRDVMEDVDRRGYPNRYGFGLGRR